MEDTIGIDVSKDNLDAYRLSKGEHKQFGNDKAGVKALALWAKKAGSHASFLNRLASIIAVWKQAWRTTASALRG
jgi:transposase